MPSRELREKYGGSGTSRALINKAVRAELVGGDHCLNALDSLRCLEHDWRERGWIDQIDQIQGAVAGMERLADSMRAEIRRRYGIPPE